MYLLYAGIFFLMSSGAFAADSLVTEVLSQADAQKLGAQANQVGSDQSLRSSTTTAMQALIKFSDNDITGAFSTAYQAYGKFKTSENLDRARKQGLLAKASMGSAESSNLTESEIAFLGSSTSYRRLDTSFLSKGDDAKIAKEFEQKTGITGGDFVKMLASASESKLYVSDPKLAEKVDAEFESFVEKIPNPEFRVKVKGALELVPSLTRHKLLVKGVQKMVALMGPVVPPPMSEAEINKLAARIAQAGPIRTPAAVPEVKEVSAVLAPEVAVAAEGKKESPAEEDISTKLHSDEMAKASEDILNSQKLDSVFRAAVESENESIFQRVSKRYRALVPRLLPRKE